MTTRASTEPKYTWVRRTDTSQRSSIRNETDLRARVLHGPIREMAVVS